MKRHKKMNRRMTNRVKAAVSALLVSSMVLNPWYGIDLAVGSENNSTRVRVSGFTGGTVKVNLESSTLKEEALRAIRESAPTELENYLSTDSTTDAAVAKLLSDPNPYYTVALWTAEDEEVFAAEGIDVKVLVQKDASTIEEDEANVASASNLKKAGQFFGASVKNRKDKDIIFYPAGGTLDTLLSDFQTDTLGHAAAETESLDNSDYELTGDEKITILYMNTDTKSHSFKLSVDGNDYSAAVKVAGTGAAAKSMLNRLKAVMKGETETAAEETESTTAAEDNVLNPTRESETKTTEEFKNTEEVTVETESTAEDSKSEDTTETTVTEENTTKAESTEAVATEAQTAEVSQAESEETVEKESLVEKAVEAVTEEVQQLSGENTVTRIGAFTLDKFLEEAESEAVKTEEKTEAAAEKSEEKAAEAKTEDKTEEKTEEVKEEKTTAAEDTTAAEENTNQEATTEAETSAESTESKAEESTTAAEGTTAASQEETTAVETSAAETTAAVETTEAETKAKTAMDESLAAEQKQLLSETSAADLAAELKTARLVQYTLGDLTSDFKSVTLTDANGEDAYVIRVSADKEGVIGEDWTLVAKEIVKEDAEAVTTDFDTMDEDTKATLEKEGLYDQSSSLDIHFTDAEGNEVEPQGQVKVEIEVSTSALPEDVNPENLQVYHLEEKNNSLNVTNVANPEDIKTLDADGEVISKSQAVEKVEAETETTAAEDNADAAIMTAELSEEAAAEAKTETTTTEVARLSGEVAKIKTSFTVDSFSTFTITWSGNGYRKNITVHYYDQSEKKEIKGSQSRTVRLGYHDSFTASTYMEAITGYTAVEAKKGDSSGPYSGDSNVITTLSYLDATNVNDIWLVYQKDAPATGIKFKYFSLAQLRKNGIQGTKDDGTYGNDYAITPYNTIKYTVECYKRIAKGNDQWEYVLQDIPEDAVIPDFSFDDNELVLNDSTFAGIKIPGFTFDDRGYAYWFWEGTYSGSKKTVTKFQNTQTISTEHPEYLSYIGFDVNETTGQGNDYSMAGGYRLYAYNPTGTLRVVLFEASSYTVKFFNFAGNGLNTASVGESKSNTHQVESGDDRGKWVATLAMPTNTSAINYTTGKGLTAPDGSTYDPAGDSDWSFDGWYNGYDADGNGTKSSDTSDKTCTDLNGQIRGNETLYSDYNVYAKWSRKLAVTKTFEGLDAADRPTDFGIQISDSDSNVKADLSLTNATTSNEGKTYTWKVSGLALNGEYTVTENPGTAPTNFELKEVKIGETTTEPVDGKYSTTIQFTKNSGAVAFTNTYQRQDAYLLIEKKISDASDGWNASDDFYFNVKVGEQNDAYAEMLTYSIGNISDMAAGAKAKDLVTATATGQTGSSGSYTISTKGQTYIAVKLPKAAGLTVAVGELANATATTAMSANSKTDNGYTLLSITGDSQTLDGTDAGKTAVFTNERKIPNPTGVRTNGTAGMMAIFMGLGMMGLMSAGYVVVRRKRW